MKTEVLQLKELVRESVKHLYKDDKYLIEYAVHEVTITHRLAIYIEEAMKAEKYDPRYCVDIEYNKDLGNKKCLVKGENGKRPDIIVHQRGNNEHNLLLVELKKNKPVTEGDADDRKLRGATERGSSFKYKLGVYLNIRETDCHISWYSEEKSMEFEELGV